jgi:O-succinylbenzoic acid--CoA ligase
MQIEGWLERATRLAPERVALETPAERWSYGELHGLAHVGAGALIARGAGHGKPVAIALPAGPAFVQALHACLLLGAIAVPVDPRLSRSEQERILHGAAVVIDEPLPREGGTNLNGSRHQLDDPALIVHTSGTTAAPRPVTLTYANILWSALGSGVALGVDPAERWLCTLPLSHVGGLSILLRSTIYATTAVVHERFETDRVLAALRAGEVTLVSLVATTLGRLLDAGLDHPPALRLALTGGGPVPAALVERARGAGVPVSLTYGLTETCSQVTTTPLAELDAEPPSAGPPLFCTRLRIAEDGEILVAGPTVAPSAELAEGWLATGDLGRLDERGRLQVTGRKADTIVSGGENVAPAEVEAVLEAHPGVLEAAVLARADDQWGEAVTAIVVARPGSALEAEELRAHCSQALAPFKVPKQFSIVSQPLPRTPSGKLLRRELG